mmetsp:Transcript_29661/g.78629  ORF Transcript_29661/g.78629 Transcript_29661/m.78629 type:complete len:98 (-) Transcript_29661:213-506(-)
MVCRCRLLLEMVKRGSRNPWRAPALLARMTLSPNRNDVLSMLASWHHLEDSSPVSPPLWFQRYIHDMEVGVMNRRPFFRLENSMHDDPVLPELAGSW